MLSIFIVQHNWQSMSNHEKPKELHESFAFIIIVGAFEEKSMKKKKKPNLLARQEYCAAIT